MSSDEHSYLNFLETMREDLGREVEIMIHKARTPKETNVIYDSYVVMTKAFDEAIREYYEYMAGHKS